MFTYYLRQDTSCSLLYPVVCIGKITISNTVMCTLHDSLCSKVFGETTRTPHVNLVFNM